MMSSKNERMENDTGDEKREGKEGEKKGKNRTYL